MASSKITFIVQQPDGLLLEHVIVLCGADVYGWENLRIHKEVDFPTLIKHIMHQGSVATRHGVSTVTGGTPEQCTGPWILPHNSLVD